MTGRITSALMGSSALVDFVLLLFALIALIALVAGVWYMVKKNGNGHT